jgi:hypothetical protein
MAGPGETLGSPWSPLAVHPCFNAVYVCAAGNRKLSPGGIDSQKGSLKRKEKYDQKGKGCIQTEQINKGKKRKVVNLNYDFMPTKNQTKEMTKQKRLFLFVETR